MPFTGEELKLREVLVFWVLLCTPLGCLFMAVHPLTTTVYLFHERHFCPPRGSPLMAPSLPASQSFPKSYLFYVTNAFWGFFLPTYLPWLRLPSTPHSMLQAHAAGHVFSSPNLTTSVLNTL